MNWLKKQVIKWVREDWENERQEIQSHASAVVCESDVYPMSNADPVLNFRVFSAVGGRVVEFRRYDRKTDRSDTTTYVVNSDEDFGESVARIANMEMFKS
jgi:hypothetical protein